MGGHRSSAAVRGAGWGASATAGATAEAPGADKSEGAKENKDNVVDAEFEEVKDKDKK